jgi:hypothetical protein
LLGIQSSGQLFIRVRAEGVLTAADYRAFEPRFADDLARRSLPVPLLLDLTNFRGWTFAGFVRDLRFDLRHRNTFSRIAVVGSRKWHRWITYAALPIFTAELKFFWPQDDRLGTAWLCEGH